MRVIEDYAEALRTQDWEKLATCLAPDVHRNGPYLDVVEGREAYVRFLSSVIPTLAGYDLRIRRIRTLEGGSAMVELTEHLEVAGAPREYLELLVFDFDAGGRIRRVDIYVKQPPERAELPPAEGSAGR